MYFGYKIKILNLLIFVYIKFVTCKNIATTLNPNLDELDPLWYLNKFGYLDTKNIKPSSKKSANLMMLPNNLNPNSKAVQEAIRKFQKYARLNETGELDSDTLKMMKMPRCGHPDIPDKKNTSKNIFRKRRYALQGSKWPNSKLRFKIAKYPKYSSMSRELINFELKRAFELWSEVSDVDFEQVFDNQQKNKNFADLLILTATSKNNLKNNEADIDVKFESGYHGDSEPFDGSGLILGHAYFPEFGGSTHFDADEYWTSKSQDGVNLYQVAVHEFGHALGLEHSDNFDAIMAPFFRGYTTDFKLHPDDLTAIEMLYGKRKRNKVNIEPNFRNNMPNVYENNIQNFDFLIPSTKQIKPKLTTEKKKFSVTKLFQQTSQKMPNNFNKQPEYFEQSTISLCLDGKFDAITVLSDGYTYIFKDAYVFKIDSNFIMDKNYPKLINNVFRGFNGLTYMNLPNNLDTVLYVPDNGVTYFFKNNLYWRSSRLYELDPGYPRLISENFKGLNAQNGFNGKLDASFVWSGNRRIYFVQSNRYWRYDFELGSVEPGYPKSLNIWRGLPKRITDAFLWVNGVTYFFENEKYYRFNDLAFKVEEDAVPSYPRFNKDYWFGCSALKQFGKLVLNSTKKSNYSDFPESNPESIEFERIEKLVNFSLIKATTSKIVSVDISSNSQEINISSLSVDKNSNTNSEQLVIHDKKELADNLNSKFKSNFSKKISINIILYLLLNFLSFLNINIFRIIV